MAKRDNKGFDPAEIQTLKEELKESNSNFIIVDEENRGDDYVQFHFLGKFEGEEAIFDCVIYTLRLHHSSEIYELAEQEAEKEFPEYSRMTNDGSDEITEEDEKIGLFIAETILAFEEEEIVKVKEHVDVDLLCDYGVGLDVGLNEDEITDEVITKFVSEYTSGKLKLDTTLYSFQHDSEEDEEED